MFFVFSFAKAQEDSVSEISTTSSQKLTDEDTSQWYKNRIGLYGSFFSGYGLSYQHQFNNGFSIRTQLFATGSNDDNSLYNNDEIQLTYGIDLQYNLKRTKSTRLYVLLGSFIDYNESGGYYYGYSYDNDYDDYDIERYINVGVAFGIELMAWRNISLVIEGGYYGRIGNNSVSHYKYIDGEYIKYWENERPKTFGFGVGGGISYAF